jgi:hypothetical protein
MSFLLTRTLESLAGISSLTRDVGRGNPFHGQWNPGQGSVPMPIRSAGGIPFQNIWNTTQGEIPAQPTSSNYGIN